jgi:hypothetical protein
VKEIQIQKETDRDKRGKGIQATKYKGRKI